MISEKLFHKEIDLIIANAIREDIGEGDHSSLACISEDARGSANFVDPGLKLDIKMEDGDAVKYGDVCFYVSGLSQSILKSERLVLNGMQRMSAIATKTNEYVKLLDGSGTKILDTRKTTPGIRALEKWAVKIGGGENHRFGLYDMIMLKDNHLDFCGGITKAIETTRAYLKSHKLNLKIIIEVRNLSEVEEVLKTEGVYRILIDNFNYEDTRRAVTLIGDKCLTESSGGITLDTLRKYADCGVDYISSGALTHSVHNMDLSLKAI